MMNPSILEFLKERGIGKAKVRDSNVVSHLLYTRLLESYEHPNIEERYIRVLKDLFNKAVDEMLNDKTGDSAPSLKVFIGHFSDFTWKETDIVKIDEFVHHIAFLVDAYRIPYFSVPETVWRKRELIDIHEGKFQRMVLDDQ